MLAKKLISYYQNELAYLKTQGKAFARHFPKVARRLGMSEGTSEDPHIERMIESFALVTAQIQQRLDEDMPEVTDALLTVLAPQFLRPFPSVCIVQMLPDSKVSALTASNRIDAGTALYSRPVNGQICRFRTTYPVTLQPVSLHKASLHLDDDDMSWSLKMQLSVWPGATLTAETLRIHLRGTSTIVNILYTLLCSEVESLSLFAQDHCHTLSPQAIHAVGFDEDEGLLSGDSRVSPTHSLLQDYFFFPQKFHFIDMPLPAAMVAGGQTELSLVVKFNRCAMARQLEKIAGTVDENLFLLNCTPAINLFAHRAEPISPDHETAEYPVIPDIRYQDAMEVWSVDSVSAMRKQGNETRSRPIYPLFGLDHSASDGESGLFWQCMRRETLLNEGVASTLFIAFSDRGEKPLVPGCDIVSLSLSCTNRDVPAAIWFSVQSQSFGEKLSAPLLALQHSEGQLDEAWRMAQEPELRAQKTAVLTHAAPLLGWLSAQPSDVLLRQGKILSDHLEKAYPGNEYSAQWQRTMDEKAGDIPALDGFVLANKHLDELEARLLNAEKKHSQYMTVSELKTAVYQIRQDLQRNGTSAETLLWTIQQDRENNRQVNPALIKQISQRIDALNAASITLH